MIRQWTPPFKLWENTARYRYFLILIKADDGCYLNSSARLYLRHADIVNNICPHSFCGGGSSVMLHTVTSLPPLVRFFSLTLVYLKTMINEWNKKVKPFRIVLDFLNFFSGRSLSEYQCVERTGTIIWSDTSLTVAIRVLQILAMHLPLWTSLTWLWKTYMLSPASTAAFLAAPSLSHPTLHFVHSTSSF